MYKDSDEWFIAAIAREKAARRAKGLSDELGADTIRLLAESARRWADINLSE